jgi:nucleoid-associated protein YgaU
MKIRISSEEQTIMKRQHFGLLLVTLLVGVYAVGAQDGSYTVQRGDTLDGIAAFYDVQTRCLAESNGLERPGELRIGQVINIDFSCPRYDGLDFVTNPRDGGGAASAGQGGGATADDGPPQPGPNDTTYIVERGDTLDTIGQELDVSVVSLQLANNIKAGQRIFPGDTLIIPADAPPYGQFPAIANPNAPLNTQELGQGGGATAGPNDQAYVVQLQDTLDGIGARFDTQVACIAEANSLDNPRLIFPGQTVVIPASCPRYDGFDTVTNPRGE